MIPTLFNSGLVGKPSSGGGAVGGWVELARTTLGSAGDTITVSSLPDKRYYMILADTPATGGAIYQGLRVNNDSGSNYAIRKSYNSGADATYTSTSQIQFMGNAFDTPIFGVGYLSNLSSKEKLFIAHSVAQSTAGSGTSPVREEQSNKWSNTSDAVNRFDLRNTSAGSYATNSEVVVLGWDESDTHTTNFWEELGSADWVSGSSLPTVSFTAKKYLWVQCWTSGGIGGDGANRVSIRVGNGSIDTSSNYSFRNSESGGADSTSTSDTYWLTHTGNKKNYMNMFIINNASNEKLAIYHTSEAANGASNAPTRIEGVGKWANTSNQINRLSVFDNTGGNNFDAGTVKIWGSD